jgi:hypothetical protein
MEIREGEFGSGGFVLIIPDESVRWGMNDFEVRARRDKTEHWELRFSVGSPAPERNVKTRSSPLIFHVKT